MCLKTLYIFASDGFISLGDLHDSDNFASTPFVDAMVTQLRNLYT